MVNVKQLREKLEGNIESLSEETLNQIIKDCEEKPEPEPIKNGMFGYWKSTGTSCIFIKYDGAVRPISEGGIYPCADANYIGNRKDYCLFDGNIFDIIRQWATPCENGVARGVDVKLRSSRVWVDRFQFSPDEAIKLGHLIIQEAYTAKSNNNLAAIGF